MTDINPLHADYNKKEAGPGIFAWYHKHSLAEATLVVYEGAGRVEVLAAMPTHLLRDKDVLKKVKALYVGQDVTFHRDYVESKRQASLYNPAMPTSAQEQAGIPFTRKPN